MKVLLLILSIVVAATVAVSANSPKWLTDFLPPTDKTSLNFKAAPVLSKTSPWIAAYGRVEPATEERKLAFEISGLIETVLVNEGESVQKNQTVATLRSDAYAAQLEEAKAMEAAKRSAYKKIVAGARKEVKSEAWAVVQRAKWVRDNLKQEMERRRNLFQQNLIAKEEVDRSIKDFRVAEKQYEEAFQRHLVTKNQSRKEDIAVAYAEYNAARKETRGMEAEFEKTILRSPIDGIVMKKHRLPGENVSIFFESPVLTVGDNTRFNIRAEVDERNAGHIKQGQEAYFTCETFGDRRINGEIVRVGGMIGKKTIPPPTASDKVDHEVIEVIIEIKDFRGLITGLTGDVFINVASPSN